MDKQRTAGAAQKGRGRIKEGLGKLMGDAKLEAEGKADRAIGAVRNSVGGLKDALGDPDRTRH